MTSSFIAFSWRGKPIHDIHEWTKARGEKMVKVRATRTFPNIWTGKIEKTVSESEMPESFWEGHVRYDGRTSTHYEEIDRYDIL